MKKGFLSSSAFTASFIIVMLVIQILLLAWNLHASSQNPMPALDIAATTWDAGPRVPGELVEMSIPLANQGHKRLILREDRPGCESCADQFPMTLTIAPRSSHELRLQFQAPRSSGPVQRTFSFLTNDPKSPRLTLTLKATISDPEPVSN